MDSSQTLPDFIASAAQNGTAICTRISDTKEQTAATDNDAILELQALCVDVFTTFEARMQQHFKRGPFSRKLKQLLITSERPELANRVYHYYLAINVLKHGKGASYRELLETDASIVQLRSLEHDENTQSDASPLGLVDVTAPLFFQGLCDTLLEAHDFLETT